MFTCGKATTALCLRKNATGSLSDAELREPGIKVGRLIVPLLQHLLSPAFFTFNQRGPSVITQGFKIGL
jgi:hypothetical protein